MIGNIRMSTGRPDFNRKRSREVDAEKPTSTDLTKDFVIALTNLGDPHAKISFEEELKLCCTDITSLWPLEQTIVTTAVIECLLGLPHKTSNYVLLVGLLFRDQKDIAIGIINSLSNTVLMEEKPWWMSGQILRVFSELATIKVVSVLSLTRIIEQCVAALPNRNALHSLHYALPFALKLLSSEQSVGLQEIVTKINESFSQSDINESFSQSDTSQMVDCIALELNYEETFKKIMLEYESSALIKISPVEDADEAIDVTLPAALSFSCEENRVCPADLLQKSFILDEGFVDSWEEVILYRYVFHLLSCSLFNPRKCCELLFAAIPESIGSPEKLVAQSLFGAMKCQYKMQVEFILIAGCRHSKLFPSAMARCLFRLVDEMERPRFDHFYMRSIAGWFALHLNTFDFKWPWDEWKLVCELPEHNGKSLFVHFTFEYLSRLSYHEKLIASIPTFLHTFLPSPPSPCSLVEQDSQFASLVAAIKAKNDAQEVASLLVDLDSKFKFVEALLFVGSKSFSHVSILLERYMDIFRSIGQEDPHRLLSTIGNFWQNQTINNELIVGKLLSNGVILSKVFVEWEISGLEDAINNSSMTLFAALNRYLPLSIVFSDALADQVHLIATMLSSMASNVVADRQIIELLEQIAKSLTK